MMFAFVADSAIWRMPLSVSYFASFAVSGGTVKRGTPQRRLRTSPTFEPTRSLSLEEYSLLSLQVYDGLAMPISCSESEEKK